MVRHLHRGTVIFLDTRVEEHLVLPFPVKAVLLANLVFHVQLEHQLQVVPLFLAPALKEVLHLPAVLLALRHLPADLRKATRVIHPSPATDPRQLRRAPPPLLQAVVPYPWIPLSYPVHLRWNKSRCSAK
jgi:hypothetical protein